MARKYVAPAIEYATVDVFAAAVRAFKTNNGYYKESKAIYAPEDIEQNHPIVMPRNLDLMKSYLSDKVQFTTDECDEARTIVAYYQGKLIELMSGKLNSYSQAACHVANTTKIESLIEVGLVASLPKAYRSSVKFDAMLEAKERAFAASSHFGTKGDHYEGRVKGVSSVYSQKWFRYFHTAQDLSTLNVVNFSTNNQLDVGEELTIRGRIKDHVEGGVTRLNYVKMLTVKNTVDAAN